MEEDKENIKIDKKEGYCLILANPKIYPLDVIYSAAYVFLDKAYILLDGDPEKKIVIELRLKKEADEKDIGKEEELEKLGRDFFNELLNYSFYKKQAEKNSKIREVILQTALLANSREPEEIVGIEDIDTDLKDVDEDLKDPEGIKIPWEDKNENEKQKKDGPYNL